MRADKRIAAEDVLLGAKEDKQRFVDWIDRHHERLYRHALWMTGEVQLACDLVQETYYQAWKGRRQLRDPDRALAWLLTILRRNAFKASSMQAPPMITLRDLGCSEGELSLDELLDLMRGLQELRPSERDILLLYALHGFSYREIGDQLQIPVGTVMSRLSRARAVLRKNMQRDTEVGGKVLRFPSRARGNKP